MFTVSKVFPKIFPDVAVIVVGPAATAVASPEALIVALVVSDELHVADEVTFCVLLSEYVPVAVNCWVAPTAILGFAGVTAIEDNVAPPLPPDGTPPPPPPPHDAVMAMNRSRRNGNNSSLMPLLPVFFCFINITSLLLVVGTVLTVPFARINSCLQATLGNPTGRPCISQAKACGYQNRGNACSPFGVIYYPPAIRNPHFSFSPFPPFTVTSFSPHLLFLIIIPLNPSFKRGRKQVHKNKKTPAAR
jgi:hypothetical protein